MQMLHLISCTTKRSTSASFQAGYAFGTQARRAATVREKDFYVQTQTVKPALEPIAPPSKLLALTEIGRAAIEFGALPIAAPLLMSAPRGDGHPVMVLPGFTTTDLSTAVLRRYLRRLGYDAQAWQLGRNLGPRAIGWEGEKLIARLDEIHAETGKTVSHCGLGVNGTVLYAIADRLSQDEDSWKPFERKGLKALLYPSSGHKLH